MKAEHINPFLSACKDIFMEMAQIELNTKGTKLKTTPVATKNVVIMVSIIGDLLGSVAINLDIEFAKKIASNMMCGMPVENLDEMSMSALKELSNITMGRVATAFSQMGKNIDIAPPTLMVGDNMLLSVTYVPLLSINFGYENFDMDFDVSIKENIK